MSDAVAFLSRAIEQGRGLAKADIVLKGGRIFDLVSGELDKSDVAICADRIVGTLGDYRGVREIDVRGKVIVPGFIDTHCTVESSLITPLEFDRCVLRHGVTTAICDPHEIANVLGATGLRYFLDGAMATAMDLRVQLSSCVPATHLETSGARLEVDDLLPLARPSESARPRRIHEFPGRARARSGLPRQARRVSDPADRRPQPAARAATTSTAISPRASATDHEVTNAARGAREASKGMQMLIREGSVSQGPARAGAASSPSAIRRSSRFCTDDRNPLDIAEEGHLDFLIRTAIGLGAPPLAAYRAASDFGARAFSA